MLIILMYHQIATPNISSALTAFSQHLDKLQQNYPIILPGEPITANTINICLTFDDAYYDFYYYIFPLLTQKKIPAVLAIPTNYIQETTTATPQERLAIGYPNGLDLNQQQHTPLCCWQEIKEMVASGYVIAASHTHNHYDLTNTSDLQTELLTSKEILEQKLATKINTIIYPYGKTSNKINKIASKYYNYLLRIGSATNLNWDSRAGLLYRINAEPFWQQQQPLTPKSLRAAKFKYWLNYLRNK